MVAVCGRSQLSPDELSAAGLLRTWSLVDLEPDPAVSIRDAAPLLERVGESLAQSLPTLLPPLIPSVGGPITGQLS